MSPGAIMIPHEDRVWVAVAEAAKNYERYDKPWRGSAYGLDLKPGLKIVTNTWRKGRVTPEQLLTEPARWATIEYQTVESADVRGEVQLRVTRGGTAHGLSLWFDSTLVEGVELTNAPGAPETLYGQAFFPLSEPVDVAPGDVVSVAISATLVGEDYIWRWDTRIVSGGRPAAVKAAFSQSNFLHPFSHARLRKRAASHVPSANLDGEILRHALARFGSQKSLQEIAEELVERFPERFGDRRQALEVAADVSEKYGQ